MNRIFKNENTPLVKSKRGQLSGESLSLFVTTLIIIILLAVFYLLIKGYSPSVNSSQIDRLSLKDSMDISLKNYLSTPLEINYSNKTIEIDMVDLINLAKINDSYKPILEDKTRKIFDEVYGKNNYKFEVKGLFSINMGGSASHPTLPSITFQKREYADEVYSDIKLPSFEVILTLKIKK